MCLKTDTILLKYTLYQIQYFVAACLLWWKSISKCFRHPGIIAGLRAGLAGLNLGYPENPAKLGSSIFLCGFELVSWVLKNYKLDLAG